ncbi:cleavage stimulation factor subunit 2 tau variant [Condylostylus longicornis]|uniref:cleavage stimulation factor subunit 2 tau variant n=1 Tax=Condylostylus longicornis TaxID=2530218 RepID=UPI00244D9D2E|nr:cleavage stimulation factor subunit 2 tau variant [Condylostylus longicornis]
MTEKNNEQSIMDKSMRSVFVGNIPYEATEEKLKEIFSEVGPVISLKLVFDRESGKPKGYGFCEYKDQETALSAMRNLNGYEIGGRTLRVDNACTEKSRMEMQQLLQGPQVENPYGEHCEPELAPENITKTVASLPPEQMYELMKQMKTCIQNNPSETRQMLLLNPQLAYALLQAMVVMRIVDPQTALSMLFKANQMPPVLINNPVTGQPQMSGPPQPAIVPAPTITSTNTPTFGSASGDIDLRSVDPRNVDPRQLDPRIGGIDPRITRNLDQDMRGISTNPAPVPPPINNPDPRTQRAIPPVQPAQPTSHSAFPNDPRQSRSDPRLRGTGTNQTSQPLQQGPLSSQNRLPSNGIPSDASDHEKAALIMQVLQLSDEQIGQLPPEQRQSILVLKEQIAKSTQR